MGLSMFYLDKKFGVITFLSFAYINYFFQIFVVSTKVYVKRVLNRLDIFNEILF